MLTLLSGLWKFLGIKGVALIGALAACGFLWFRLHMVQADLTAANGKIALAKASEVSATLSIGQLEQANRSLATKLQANAKLLALGRQEGLQLAAQNRALAAQTNTRQQRAAALALNSACGRANVPQAVVHEICAAGVCR